jgi:hypothetical protein
VGPVREWAAWRQKVCVDSAIAWVANRRCAVGTVSMRRGRDTRGELAQRRRASGGLGRNPDVWAAHGREVAGRWACNGAWVSGSGQVSGSDPE